MIVTIALVIACGIVIGLLGRRYAFGFWGHFFVSIILFPFLGLFSPVVGVLVLLAGIPPRQIQRHNHRGP